MIEVEVDTPTNGNLMFQPTLTTVRGRFMPARVASKHIGELVREFPEGVPGQRIRLDPVTGTGAILEPLADPAAAELRAAVAKRLTRDPDGKVEYAPAKQTFADVHVPTWTLWIMRAVRAGLARVVKGTLPDIEPADGKRDFFARPTVPDAKDAVIEKLTGLLIAKLTPAERKELASILGK